MKLNKYIYFLIAFIIIFIMIFYNTRYQLEEFTPSIREMYRPYVRNARLFGEGFYVKHKTNVTSIFRKFGIM
jgi:hypothetical protein